MSFLGGLFDAFTGDSAKDASNKNAALYNNYRSDATTALNSAYGTGINALTGGLNNAVGAVNGGLNNAVGAVNAGVSNATPYYQQAAQGFAPFAGAGQTGLAGESMLGNAYGLNGQGGIDKARAAFQAGPGYQWNVNQNLDQVARNQAKLGMANSGNTLTALQDRANNLANQEYSQWLSGLGTTTQTGLNAGLQGAQGASGALTGLGNIFNTAGTNLGNLYNSTGANLGNLYNSNGTALAGLGSNYADSLANVQGQATSGLAGSNTAAGKASMDGSQNLWNGLFSLGGAATKAFMPVPGGGTLGGLTGQVNNASGSWTNPDALFPTISRNLGY